VCYNVVKPVSRPAMAELEGFICSLCKQDLKTFHHLEAHFREEHDETTGSKRRTNLKSLFDKARTFGRKRQRDHEVDEGAAAVSMRGAEGEERGEGPITNISGIDPEYWAPQEFGTLVFNLLLSYGKTFEQRMLLGTV